MAQVDLELNDLSAPELIATGTRLIDGLTDNPLFPKQRLPLDDLKSKLGQLEAALDAYRKQRLQLNEMKTQFDAMMREVRGAIHTEAEYVEEASGGDAKNIISAHLAAERSWHFWPFGTSPQVTDLSASIGAQPGEIKLMWDRLRGADGYEVECTTGLAGDGPWEQCAVANESYVTVKNLNPHCRYWFRVRAVGEKGKGDWSDPVTKYSR